MAGPLAGRRILLGITGGIAAYKAAYLARLLRERGADVQVVMTAAATRFVGPETFAALTGRPVRSDAFERSEEVLHVRLAHEADAAVVAPATANALAKMALGLADDLLSSALLELSVPVVVAPAMHSGMWSAPATRVNLETLRSRGVVVVGPEAGALAAGDEGLGRMAEPETIAGALEAALAAGSDLAGRHVLVTAGPTYEPLDAVRFLGNRSTGKMGFEVAREAAARGASVTLVTGPTHLPDPPGVEVERVETAEEMHSAVLAAFERTDAVVKAAAVADFRPADRVEGKLKKADAPPELRLEPTRDILRELGEGKGTRVLIGFAAETGDLEAEGRRKLSEKHLDVVVVNRVGEPGTGFGSETDVALVLGREGELHPARRWTKRELAAAVCDALAKLLAPSA